MTEEARIQDLHHRYGALTGLHLQLTMARRFIWLAWLAHGFAPEDMEALIRHYQRTVADRTIRLRMLRFERLIGDPARFEEDLAEARACARPGPATTRTVRSGSTTRILPDAGTQDTCKPVAGIVRGLEPGSRWTLSPENLAAWQKMKEGLQ